jgi:hypothetical protein
MATKLAEYKFETDYDSFERITNRLYDELGSSAYYKLSIDKPSSSYPGYVKIYDDLSDQESNTAGRICRTNGGELC